MTSHTNALSLATFASHSHYCFTLTVDCYLRLIMSKEDKCVMRLGVQSASEMDRMSTRNEEREKRQRRSREDEQKAEAEGTTKILFLRVGVSWNNSSGLI